MTLPDPPAPIVRPAEYAFGDHVANAEEHLVGQIDQSLRGRFDKPAEAHLAAPADTDFAAVRRWYGERAEGVAGIARCRGGRPGRWRTGFRLCAGRPGLCDAVARARRGEGGEPGYHPPIREVRLGEAMLVSRWCLRRSSFMIWCNVTIQWEDMMSARALAYRQSRIADPEPLSALNITPLIDVLLVLIVTLILTIPMMTHKVPIDLPGGGVPTTETNTIHRIDLNAAGQISLDGATCRPGRSAGAARRDPGRSRRAAAVQH